RRDHRRGADDRGRDIDHPVSGGPGVRPRSTLPGVAREGVLLDVDIPHVYVHGLDDLVGEACDDSVGARRPSTLIAAVGAGLSRADLSSLKIDGVDLDVGDTLILIVEPIAAVVLERDAHQLGLLVGLSTEVLGDHQGTDRRTAGGLGYPDPDIA